MEDKGNVPLKEPIDNILKMNITLLLRILSLQFSDLPNHGRTGKNRNAEKTEQGEIGVLRNIRPKGPLALLPLSLKV